MPRAAVRAHVVIPKDVLDSVDELVGQRGRSRFFTEAVEEKLARTRLAKAARDVVGSLANEETPGWETSESAAEWVRASRREDAERLQRIWEER